MRRLSWRRSIFFFQPLRNPHFEKGNRGWIVAGRLLLFIRERGF
jgi:hypothetical protein